MVASLFSEGEIKAQRSQLPRTIQPVCDMGKTGVQVCQAVRPMPLCTCQHGAGQLTQELEVSGQLQDAVGGVTLSFSSVG